MGSVFSRTWRSAAVGILILVLLAPSAAASDTTSDASLWTDFVAWLASFDVSERATADSDGFSVWLMIRHTIPGG
jgi:hypothetical protein